MQTTIERPLCKYYKLIFGTWKKYCTHQQMQTTIELPLCKYYKLTFATWEKHCTHQQMQTTIERPLCKYYKLILGLGKSIVHTSKCRRRSSCRCENIAISYLQRAHHIVNTSKSKQRSPSWGPLCPLAMDSSLLCVLCSCAVLCCRALCCVLWVCLGGGSPASASLRRVLYFAPPWELGARSWELGAGS